jgi:signal transduction histidine kinase
MIPTAVDPLTLTSQSDLQTVLAAWHTATVRLEQTHEALRGEVRRLTDELEAKNRQLARKNRLADLGQMASHVAHEVRNHLVPVTLYLSLLRRRIEDAEGLGILDKISAGFTALDATVNDLLHFAADRDPQRRRFPVAELVDEVCGSLGPRISAQRVHIQLRVPRDLSVTADRDMIRRALLNLLLNALDAMPGGGTLWVAARSVDRGTEISVGDSGDGLTEEAKGRAFEPFYTTKHGGTGLGLAIVYRIAEVHGGEVSARNRPEGGAWFTLRIPPLIREAAA